jgi:hypothetical protein
VNYDNVRPSLLDLVLQVIFACKIFLDHPQYICFFVGDSSLKCKPKV